MRDASGLSKRDRLLALAVPLLVALVALLAVERHHRVEQSPWQGFGLGMFSSYEHRTARTIRAISFTDGEKQPVPVPSDLARLAGRVLAAPGDHHTERLARKLKEHTDADRVVVEVWGHEVDSGDERLTIGFRVLERVEVP